MDLNQNIIELSFNDLIALSFATLLLSAFLILVIIIEALNSRRLEIKLREATSDLKKQIAKSDETLRLSIERERRSAIKEAEAKIKSMGSEEFHDFFKN